MKSPAAIGRTIRSAGRARDMLGVLMRYGFEDVIQQIGLDRLFDKGKKLIGLRRADTELIRLPLAVRVRMALEELGPTFIKMGQILSTRPDLIPVGWAEEFCKLQSDVPPVAFDQVRKQLEQQFPDGIDSVFRSIEQAPLAAASIAQVHRAVLLDGSEIVIKVRRPGIEKTVQSDMTILMTLAEFAEEHFADFGYSPVEVVRQFSGELRRELDFTREGRSTERLGAAFHDNEHITFPKVFWQATTSSVLALEEIKGTLLSAIEPGDFDQDELTAMVSHGTEAVFRQCLEIGFFHADPHPGNIFAMGDGKICFVDCGMTGHIDPATAEHLAMLVHGVVSSDLEKVIDMIVWLTDADLEIVHSRAFRADVWEFVTRFDNVTLTQLQMGPLLQEFFEKVREHRLHCPADIVFLIKAITTIEGVAEQLAPDFNIVEQVRPLMTRLATRRFGVRAMRRRMERSLIGYAQLAEELPEQIRSLMATVRRNRLTMNLEHRGLDKMTNEIEHASNNIAHALVVASLIVSSSLLILSDRLSQEGWGVMSVLGGVGYFAAGAFAVWRAITSRFR